MPHKDPEARKKYHREYAEKNRENKNKASRKYYSKLASDPERRKLNNERKYRERDKRKANEVETFVVYYLPSEHYVGYTNKFKRRLSEHKKIDSRRDSSKKRNVDGAIIIGRFNCPIEAHLYETQLHLRGFNGFKR